MTDRTVRNLEHLGKTASTSRVLNLHSIARRKGHFAGYAERPLFQNEALNTSIIVKHRLRANESEYFAAPRQTATKIMVPIERNDLRLGARFVFVGQRRFEEALFHAFGVELGQGSQDLKTLNVLDQTPSLDPFLMREQLRRHGLNPAACYFDLTEADSRRMVDFAEREIQPLVRMSVGDAPSDASHAAKLTAKLLANAADLELEPLRLTLQLKPQQFQEGVFCWKAFLYYKWRLAELLPQVSHVIGQIERTQPGGPQSADLRAYLRQARDSLKDSMTKACRQVRSTLSVYDAAYRNLTEDGQPTTFRDFLLQAPALFSDLGEQLGAVDHIVSFWRFRFPAGQTTPISADDLADIFLDFETSLNIEERPVILPLRPRPGAAAPSDLNGESLIPAA